MTNDKFRFYLDEEHKVICCTKGRCSRSNNAGAARNGCWNCRKREKCEDAGRKIMRTKDDVIFEMLYQLIIHTGYYDSYLFDRMKELAEMMYKKEPEKPTSR
jgi:hypothetical protein